MIALYFTICFCCLKITFSLEKIWGGSSLLAGSSRIENEDWSVKKEKKHYEFMLANYR